MENKKMYVITMSAGCYEDSYEKVIGVTDDFKKGSAYVDSKNSIYQSMENKLAHLEKEEWNKWLLINPKPVVKTIEGEMEITKEFQQQHKKWLKKLNESREQWIKDNLTQEEEEMRLIKDNNGWFIQEAPWI